jgi:aspartate-semialdehyde dehydrogenase
MSSHSRPAAHSEHLRAGNVYRLAIVGAGSLKGKEVAEVLSDRNFPSIDVKLLDDDESLGQLESLGDEVTFIQSLRAAEFDNVDITFFAADEECTHKTWETARKAGNSIVDLSYALEDQPDAMVRSPWIERQLGTLPPPQLQPGPAVVAHPAAVVLALLLLRAQKAGAMQRTVATVFEPASEHGQKGMDELHEQTVNLLSFQQMPKNVFDTQVAFNLVARYGDNAAPALASIEQRVLKHFGKIVGKSVPQPSLLMLQAPIFHGHAFAIHVQFRSAVAAGDLAQALSGEHVNVARANEEFPSNVSAAGQGDVLVAVMPDTADAKAFWLWAATDNLRIAASTAVECAETMAASRPRGKIQ